MIERARRLAARLSPLVLACALSLASLARAAEPSTVYLPPSPVHPATAAGAGVGEGADLLLIAFSGRCALRSCTPPDENVDALARRLVPAALAVWRASGLDVEAWTYRSHVGDHPERGRGYLSAAEDLRNAVQDNVLGPDGDTRVVLLGYSHGTQFAHLLAFEHPEVHFAAAFAAWTAWVLEVMGER